MNPDAEAIIALNPDIIIASGHNKTGGEDPFAPIKEAGISVVYIPSSASFEGIYEDIDFIASIVDKDSEGEKLVTEMQTEIDRIKDIAATITDKKTVYFEISPAPYIYTTGAGTFQNEIIETIGATNVFGSETGWISPSEEAILDANPDVIITNVGYVPEPVAEILAREAWVDMDAIVNGDVYLIDADASSRPSHNVVAALIEMAKAVYPEYYE
jgi:iron complex transport system substrate-binding protein